VTTAAGPRSANAAAGTPSPRLACPRGSGAPRVRRRCPESALASDITEHKTSEGKLYLRAIKNVISNRIVGYLISDRMKTRLAVDAVNSAAMESFFSLLQKNVLNRRSCDIRDQLRIAVVTWIERTHYDAAGRSGCTV